MSKLKIGDIVRCRYFNKPDGKAYGDYFEAQITSINVKADQYRVIKLDNGYITVLHRNEIYKIIKPQPVITF